MGSFSSKEKKLSKEEQKKRKSASNQSNKIDKNNTDDYKQQANTIKLLLLGAGESGKSTLFKQMIQLYGQGYDQATLDTFRDNIHVNVIGGITMLAQHSQDAKFNCETMPESKISKRFFLEAAMKQVEVPLTPQVAKHVQSLWADPAIKQLFAQHRAAFQIPDSADYFFDNVERIATENYQPTYADVLHCRARTTGIVETNFCIKDDGFKLIDVGGQRNERKKWIHCFEGVTAVLFVAAISEYDQVLFEDCTQNRMTEALTLFEEICNSRWFQKSSMILFLNKRDLFADKIRSTPISVCFPEYKGPQTYEDSVTFLTNKFLERNKNPDQMKVFVHVTCATDADNVKFTFNAVKQTIIEASLARSGLQ